MISARIGRAANSVLTRTTNLPPWGSFTIMFWLFTDSLVNNATYMYYGTSGFAGQIRVRDGASGALLQMVDSNGTTGGTVPTPYGTWSHVCVTQSATSGSNELLYTNGILDVTRTVVNITPAIMLFGGEDGPTGTMDGRIAAIKIWDRALSIGEINAEIPFAMPVSRVGLNSAYPMASGWERLQSGLITPSSALTRWTDVSGNRRDLTEVGTIDVSTGPPIKFRPGFLRPTKFATPSSSTTPVSNTSASSTESIGRIFQALAAPDESIGLITKAQAASDESVAPIVQAFGSPDESVGRIASTAAGADESAGRIASTLGVPDESVGLIAGTRISSDESIGRVLQTVATPDESVGRVASTVVTPDESVGRVAQTAAAPDESIGRVASTNASPDESQGLALVSGSQTSPWESLGRVAGTRAAPDESLGRIAAPSTTADESISPVSSSRAAAIESVGRVAAQRTAPLESVGRVASPWTSAMEILGRITSALTSAWESIYGGTIVVRPAKEPTVATAQSVKSIALATSVKSLAFPVDPDGVVMDVSTVEFTQGETGPLVIYVGGEDGIPEDLSTVLSTKWNLTAKNGRVVVKRVDVTNRTSGGHFTWTRLDAQVARPGEYVGQLEIVRADNTRGELPTGGLPVIIHPAVIPAGT